MSTGFDADTIIAGLRPFQRHTVEHVVDRFYGPDGCRRFLVADETGLGKSMVARGVIARAIEYLEQEPGVERIDVLYVCSNVDLARQNLRRLNVTGSADVPMPGRLGLLAVHSGNLKHDTDNDRKPVNLVSLTPGTSFEKGHQTGRREERALLFWLLDRHLRMSGRQRTTALNLLRGQVEATRFPDDVADFIAANADRLDLEIEKRFVAAIRTPADGTTLLDEFTDLLPGRIPGVKRSMPDPAVVRDLIGRLRTALAHAGVEALEPDLIILDEFQRFTDLLDVNTEAGELAEQLFGYPDARVLLLSATPYKPLTLAGETEPGKSHQDQFMSTVDFLAKGARAGLAAEVTEQLELFRSAIIGRTDARPAVDALEKRLLDVMCRTERPTTEARNMVDERPVLVDGITPADLLDYVALEQLSNLTDAQLNVDYWKSVPYFANFMDTYQLGRKLADALASAEHGAAARTAAGKLSRIAPDAVRRFEPLSPGNARFRQLAEDTATWENLLWVPPSLPYLKPGGAFADRAVEAMTKKLVFSAWSSTPPAVASLLSYGADRRIATSAVESANGSLGLGQIGERLFGDDASPVVPPRLTFRVRDGHAERMTTLALFWPMPDLADRADPLRLARVAQSAGASDDAEAGVAAQLRESLRGVTTSKASEQRREYWAWPLANEPGLTALVDSVGWPEIGSALLGHDPSLGEENDSQLDPYFREVRALTTEPAVPEQVPEDLAEVSAQLGMHSPANCAWRTLGRLGLPSTATVSGRWLASTVLASGLRSTFNRWQSILLLDREYPQLPHWQRVLKYCADGNLQSVLDEYLFHLATDLGLQSVDDAALLDLARTAAAALALRPARYQATDPLGADPVIRFPARFAMQYGSKSADDSFRPAEIRQAFNSPFWPFVLVSTSAGQEGIDFHPWCHNVAHWNTPSNPVDFEQRDGRVNRFRGHAVRRNLVEAHRAEVLSSSESSPWSAAYTIPKPDLDGLVPDWIYPGPHKVIRDVMPYRLSRDMSRLERIKSDVARYRLAFGQPRQEDLMSLLEADGVDDESAANLRLDLRPPR
ncbi:helicase-related protein [Rhodococcus sp. NPDC058521]|uniref:helicase-related protein n=1 Tax=Rhodococcus sp. NPDC058521 TaxID=3346536 RepID=UPI003646EA19